MSRPLGSWHMHTHEPWDSFGTEYRSSTLNPFITRMVVGSVAGGSLGGGPFFWATAADGSTGPRAAKAAATARNSARCERVMGGGTSGAGTACGESIPPRPGVG